MQVLVFSIDEVYPTTESSSNIVALDSKACSCWHLNLRCLDVSYSTYLGNISGIKGKCSESISSKNKHLITACLNSCTWFSCNKVSILNFKLVPFLGCNHISIGSAWPVTWIHIWGSSIQHVDMNWTSHLTLSIRSRHQVNKSLIHDDCCSIHNLSRQRCNIEPCIGMGIITFRQLRDIIFTYVPSKS